MSHKKSKIVAGFIAFALMIGLTLPAGAAYSYCMTPNAPSFYGTKPNKPFCARDSSCSQWQVDSYKREVSRYFDQLEQYTLDVARFNRDARTYVTCMSDLD